MCVFGSWGGAKCKGGTLNQHKVQCLFSINSTSILASLWCFCFLLSMLSIDEIHVIFYCLNVPFPLNFCVGGATLECTYAFDFTRRNFVFYNQKIND